jgi:hypothetical protein
MEIFTSEGLTALLQVIMIDLVLAGDNAIVIGLAAAGASSRPAQARNSGRNHCRDRPAHYFRANYPMVAANRPCPFGRWRIFVALRLLEDVARTNYLASGRA